LLQARVDAQTMTSEGEPVGTRIEGVRVRFAITHPDERGEICEIYDPAWGFHDAPLVYAYQLCIRPRRVKGWVVHMKQDDRLFVSLGVVKVVLYDDRADSPTNGLINEICLGEHNRGLITIPSGVYHAIQNIGDVDAILINMPTRPYNHAQPDKHRVPVDTDQIPYRFEDRLGW
jgi:dTDP-4-dehydrorhamnose 3,5-epimerase